MSLASGSQIGSQNGREPAFGLVRLAVAAGFEPAEGCPHALSSSAAGVSHSFGWVRPRLSRASAATADAPEPTRMRPQVRPREVGVQPAVLIGQNNQPARFDGRVAR
jgi:hypothetical protein